ncbi:VQ [Macleaya cordata]|uniref:VQ n=1 Tax=Macleaya cordata TaxID=56857 RepID=A0A200PTI8_MACCD|nr:VQ [Macleaya cordata]
MSPSQIHDDQQRLINGLRPSPLKINKDSHHIQKSSSSSSSSTSGSSSLNGVVTAVSKHHQQQRHPVIIYTHSPKVIHTEARDFMALVQKLTGLSHSEDHQPAQHNSLESKPPPSSSERNIHNNNKNNNVRATGHDDTTSSSVVTDENCGGIGSDTQVSSSSVSPVMDPISNPYITDIPVFTPNSLDFFYSSRPFYRFPNSIIPFPNMGNSISHSSSEVTERSQDY